MRSSTVIKKFIEAWYSHYIAMKEKLFMWTILSLSFTSFYFCSYRNNDRHRFLFVSFQSKLTWTPWFMHKSQSMGKKVLNGIDYTGEKLANFLGLTSPKYAYEIRQHKNNLEKKAREEQAEKENAWSVLPETSSNEPITKPPTQSNNTAFWIAINITISAFVINILHCSALYVLCFLRAFVNAHFLQ